MPKIYKAFIAILSHYPANNIAHKNKYLFKFNARLVRRNITSYLCSVVIDQIKNLPLSSVEALFNLPHAVNTKIIDIELYIWQEKV